MTERIYDWSPAHSETDTTPILSPIIWLFASRFGDIKELEESFHPRISLLNQCRSVQDNECLQFRVAPVEESDENTRTVRSCCTDEVLKERLRVRKDVALDFNARLT